MECFPELGKLFEIYQVVPIHVSSLDQSLSLGVREVSTYLSDFSSETETISSPSVSKSLKASFSSESLALVML